MAGGFVVVIPARLKSTRLPDKPLADIAGKPMVVRVAERALQCGASRVVVATDHASIVDACAAHGVEALLTRADHPSGTDRLADFVLGAHGKAQGQIAALRHIRTELLEFAQRTRHHAPYHRIDEQGQQQEQCRAGKQNNTLDRNYPTRQLGLVGP